MGRHTRGRVKKPRKKYVRWDTSGIHLHGTCSSEVRGKSWLSIRADVRSFFGRHGVYPIDKYEMIKALTFCTRQEHEAFQQRALTSVCIPGRLARVGYRKDGDE